MKHIRNEVLLVHWFHHFVVLFSVSLQRKYSCRNATFLLGIVAIFYAIRAVRAHQQGFFAESTTFYKKAIRWALITFIIGLVLGSSIAFIFFVRAVLFVWRRKTSIQLLLLLRIFFFFSLWTYRDWIDVNRTERYFPVEFVCFLMKIDLFLYASMNIFNGFSSGELSWRIFPMKNKLVFISSWRRSIDFFCSNDAESQSINNVNVLTSYVEVQMTFIDNDKKDMTSPSSSMLFRWVYRPRININVHRSSSNQ